MSDYTGHDDQPRSATEIAKRSLAIHCVIAASHRVSKHDISEWLRNERLYEELSPWERRFVEAEENTEREISQASWRVEAQVVLLWSIHKVDRMDAPTGLCNTSPLVNVIPELFSSTSGFIASATLRSKDEIEEEYERIYDIHCEVRSAKRKNIQTLIKYNSGVIQERHYALNWITGYCGQHWDEITTDT